LSRHALRLVEESLHDNASKRGRDQTKDRQGGEPAADPGLAFNDGPEFLGPGQLGQRGVRIRDGHEVEGRDDVGQAGMECEGLGRGA
jgi:hypothetical protein